MFKQDPYGLGRSASGEEEGSDGNSDHFDGDSLEPHVQLRRRGYRVSAPRDNLLNLTTRIIGDGEEES